jgi:hypothetical protein
LSFQLSKNQKNINLLRQLLTDFLSEREGSSDKPRDNARAREREREREREIPGEPRVAGCGIIFVFWNINANRDCEVQNLLRTSMWEGCVNSVAFVQGEEGWVGGGVGGRTLSR